MPRLGDNYVAALIRLVELSRRHAGGLLWLAGALTALSVYYIATHFMLDTDLSKLISSGLPSRQDAAQFDRAFPRLDDTLVVVIDGRTADLATAATGRLNAWLNAHPRPFNDIYAPGAEPFFNRNGLLYLSQPQLEQLGDALSKAEPLIARLARDPSLRGLFGLLNQAVEHTGQPGPQLPGLGKVFNQLSNAMDAQLAGRFYEVGWQELTVGETSMLSGRRRFVIVQPHFVYQAAQPAQAAIDAIRAAVRALRLDAAHGVRVRLTGSAALDNDQLHAATAGAGYALVLSLGLIVLMLIIGLRSWRLIVASIATLIAGLIWTTALGLFAFGPFNPISIAFAVLFIGLGIDFGIQFCVRYREALFQGFGRGGAARRVARTMGGALTLAAVAAAASFLSVVPTHYAGVKNLGMIAGIGMIIALFANLTVLPALLTILTRSAPLARFHLRISFAGLPAKRWRRGIILVSIAAGAASIPFAIATRFDFNPIDLQPQNTEAIRTFRDLLKGGNQSPYTIDILTPNGAAADRLAQRLESLPSVSQALTLDSYVPDHQGAKLAAIQSLQIILPPFIFSPAATLPAPGPAALQRALARFRDTLAHAVAGGNAPVGSRALLKSLNAFQRRFGHRPAALKTLQQRIIATLPGELRRLQRSLQAQQVSRDDLPKDLKQRYVTPDGRARVQVFSSLDLNNNDALRRFVSEAKSVAPHAVGPAVLLVEGGTVVVQAFLESTLIALALIALIVFVAMRHWLDVLLVLSPLGLSTLLTLAAMELAGLSFDLANIIVLPLLIGLQVAFGIYFVTRFRESADIDEVMRGSTAEAVLFSGLTTMSSFGSLAISPSPGMAILGQSLSIALACVLVATLIVLPAVLAFVHGEIGRLRRGERGGG